MVSFHEVRLPEQIEKGAKGGAGFKTTIFELSSGFEKRNVEWSRSKGKWNVGYGIQYLDGRDSGLTAEEGLNAVISFFYNRYGRAYGFRFKDWTDYQIGVPGNPELATAQGIGTGDGTNAVFQLFKRYLNSPFTYDRVITKPVQGTLSVWVSGVLQTEGTNYTANYASGVITFLDAIDAIAASNTLTYASNVEDGDTVTIDGQTYTYVTAVPASPDEVRVAYSTAASIAYLQEAINNGATGIVAPVGLGTVAHTQVTAVANPTTLVATAIATGTGGNSIATTETILTASWGASTLTGGSIGVSATGTLTFSGQPAEGETVTIGTTVYTFRSLVPASVRDVQLGATLADTITNLAEAINNGATNSDIIIGATTAAHATVTSPSTSVSSLLAEALTAGAAGNSIATTEVSTHMSWASATLTGGADAVASSIPVLNALVYCSCEFDTPVRFDTDQLSVTAETFQAGQIPSIPIIEIKPTASSLTGNGPIPPGGTYAQGFSDGFAAGFAAGQAAGGGGPTGSIDDYIGQADFDSLASVQATTTLTIVGGGPVDGDTITIGTYTFTFHNMGNYLGDGTDFNLDSGDPLEATIANGINAQIQGLDMEAPSFDEMANTVLIACTPFGAFAGAAGNAAAATFTGTGLSFSDNPMVGGVDGIFPSYSGATTYNRGDLVVYNLKAYLCILDSTSGIAPEDQITGTAPNRFVGTNWQLVAGQWRATGFMGTTAYINMVPEEPDFPYIYNTADMQVYESIEGPNQNHQPDTSPAWWSVFVP